MKHLVVQSDLRSSDIRPPGLLDDWLVLAERASRQLAQASERLVRVPCPACGDGAGRHAFERFDFLYERCASCGSLYVGLRPSKEALDHHYRVSDAATFRLSYFTEQTASARFLHVIQSRVDWIEQVLMRGSLRGAVRYADVGTLYPGLFAELRETGDFEVLASLDSDSRIREFLTKDVLTTPEAGPFHLLTAFEQLEHQFSPLDALERLRSWMAPDGLLLLTTRSGSGFDLSILEGHARYLFVPEHLNLLSLAGLERLMERAGFELLELSTPGELDIGLVRDSLLRDPSIPVPEFVRLLVEHRDEVAHRDFQEFLQKHRLSSHVRLAARRTD